MAQYPRVHGVITQQGRDISDLINRMADVDDPDHGRYPFPPRILVAQGIAESGLNETAWRDGAWPDKSAGLFQQTILYAPIGDHTASAENIAAVRRRFTTDVPFAAETAAHQLGAYYQRFKDLPEEEAFLETSSRYNGGSRLAWKDNPNRKHIQESWARSAIYEEAGSEEETVSAYVFNGGFATLAETLGADIVGEPVTDEYQLGPETRQNTTKGVMVWVDGAPALFFQAV